MLTSKVTSKGQITIPLEAREKYGIEEGDLLVYDLDETSMTLYKVQPTVPKMIAAETEGAYQAAANRILASVRNRSMSFHGVDLRSIRREELHERR